MQQVQGLNNEKGNVLGVFVRLGIDDLYSMPQYCEYYLSVYLFIFQHTNTRVLFRFSSAGSIQVC